MDTVETLVLVVHCLFALAIIGLVLIQHGKGADMGSGFGGGASSTVFGSGGSGSFLARLTTGVAIAFFLTSFGLAFFAKERSAVISDIGIPAIVTQSSDSERPLLSELAEEEVPVFEVESQNSDAGIPED